MRTTPLKAHLQAHACVSSTRQVCLVAELLLAMRLPEHSALDCSCQFNLLAYLLVIEPSP
jgi:hypothetical protein